MANLVVPSYGISGWEYTEEELVTGRLERIEIACEDPDDQFVWELLLESGPAGVRAVAQHFLDSRRSGVREMLVFYAAQEEDEPGSCDPLLEDWEVELAKKWGAGEEDPFLARRYFRKFAREGWRVYAQRDA